MSLKRFLSVLPVAAALLLAPSKASAVTYQTPSWGADYVCDYNNPPYPRVDGLSTFVRQSTQQDALLRPIHRTIEYFDATFGTENYKATWAKPENKNSYGIPYTRWELSFLNGPQCTLADVYYNGQLLAIDGCSDGHSRFCQRLY